METWDWLQQNRDALTGVGNILMVLIWAVYLQLFYRQYRRHQKPKLVVHHAQGIDSSAICLLVNMSEEAVHVQCVIAQIETDQEARVHQVTDYRRISMNDSDIEHRLRQGPLQSGGYLLLGQFENIIRGQASQQEQRDQYANFPLALQDVRALELRAVVIHGPSENPVGARRRFSVEHREGRLQIRPERLHTEQLTSRRDRRQVRRWLSDSLTPSCSVNRDL